MFKDKRFIKGIVVGMISGVVLIGSIAHAESAIRLFYNGMKIIVPGSGGKQLSPVMIKGKVYIPMEMVETVVNKPVTFDVKNNKVDIGMVTLANGNIGIIQMLTRYGWLTDDTYADNLTAKHDPSLKLPSQKSTFKVVGKEQSARDSIHKSGVTTLGKDFKRMKAKVAVADWMPKDTKGRLIIKTDGKMVFDKSLEAGKAPIIIDIDMKYVNEIEFIQEGGIEFYNVEFTPLWQ